MFLSIKYPICENFILIRHNLWKSDENTVLQTWMLVIYVWKFPKIRNKIKGLSIICSHIWHIDDLKCVYWLDIHSVKAWWRYVPPNTNAVPFCDIFSIYIGQCCLSAQNRSRETKLDWRNHKGLQRYSFHPYISALTHNL